MRSCHVREVERCVYLGYKLQVCIYFCVALVSVFTLLESSELLIVALVLILVLVILLILIFK